MSESDDRGLPNPRLYYVAMDGEHFNLDDGFEEMREKDLIVLQALVNRVHPKASGELHRRQYPNGAPESNWAPPF